MLGRQLAGGDPQVAGHPRLGVQDVVVVARHPHGALRDAAARRLLGPRPAAQLAHGRVVVEAEVHRRDERVGLRAQLGHAVLDHRQAGGQPAVVDRGEEREERRPVGRPRGQARAGGRVVPVEELAARPALQARERGQRARHARGRLAAADEPDLARAQRAPQVGADVGRRGVAAALRRRRHVVVGQPGAGVDEQVERVPGVGGVALRASSGRRARGSPAEAGAADSAAASSSGGEGWRGAGRNVGPAPTVPTIAGRRNLAQDRVACRFGPNGGAFGSTNGARITGDGLRARHGADRVPRPRGLPRRGLRRAGRRRGAARRAARRRPGADGPRAPGRRRAPARRDLHAAGHHLRADRRGRPEGPALPARPRAADHPGRGVDPDQARPGAAHPRAQRLRRRRLPRARDHPRGHRAVAAGRLAQPLRARRPRHPPARRRLHARRRLRPRARRRRHLEGARGQRPHAVGHLLRAREPRGDDAPGPRALRPVPRAPGRPLPPAPARRAARGGAQRRRRGDRRGVDAGPVQLRLLRARLPRAPDGRRAGRGLRPRRARRRALHAHDRRPGARARRLPPHRRRLRRPARVPRGLGARRARPRARLPRRDRRGGQRLRHRRGRRQGDLPLRAGDDPLLPQRGADPRQRQDLPALRSRAARARARAPRRARGQAHRRVGRQGRLHRPGDAAPTTSRGWPTSSRALPRPLDRPGGREPLDRPHRRQRRAPGARATSTCGRSRSSARTSRSSRAA